MNHSKSFSGPWTGFYNYHAGGPGHRTDLFLTFVQGIIAGQGSDSYGVYGIAGCFETDDAEIRWTKTYFGGHVVRCRGFIEGDAIWGTWEVADQAKGGFHIWPLGRAPKQQIDHTNARPGMSLPLPVRKGLQ